MNPTEISQIIQACGQCTDICMSIGDYTGLVVERHRTLEFINNELSNKNGLFCTLLGCKIWVGYITNTNYIRIGNNVTSSKIETGWSLPIKISELHNLKKIL